MHKQQPLAALGLLLVVGCSDSNPALVIELGTDYLPAVEFTSVSVQVNDGTPITTPVALGQRFAEGERLTEISNLLPGPLVVVTQLLDADGDSIASRTNEIELSGNTALFVIISRNCASVVCPGVEDPVSESECLGRRCVPPTCHPGDIGACGGVECDVDSQCSAVPSCLSGRCVGGACLYVADDTSCGAGAICDPIDGCIGGPPADAGTDASMDASADTSVDAAPDSTVDAAPDGSADAAPDAVVDACVPTAELCDGIDNDCNSSTPDGADEVGLGAACDGPDTDMCAEGTLVCDGVGPGLTCDDASGDTIDRCDGSDSDCDGNIDEGLRCTSCTHLVNGTSNYLFCDESRSWASAEAVCVSAGGHLVTIDDAAENSWVRAEKSAINSGTSWYIGYNDQATESSWVWVATGLEGTYLGWASGRPSGVRAADDCAMIPVSAGWIDVECFRSWNYICEW